jgi:DNA-directed RNA polymerase specialized sigma24 family protein
VEDLTQATLVIILAKLRAQPFEPAGPTSFRSFAFTVASFHLRSDRKVKLRYHRLEQRQADLPPLPAGWWDVSESSADEATLILQQSSLLHAALAAIKTIYRCALESRLRDEDPRSFADAEGIEVGTVRWRISRAVALVSAEIEARRRTPRVLSPTQ